MKQDSRPDPYRARSEIDKMQHEPVHSVSRASASGIEPFAGLPNAPPETGNNHEWLLTTQMTRTEHS